MKARSMCGCFLLQSVISTWTEIVWLLSSLFSFVVAILCDVGHNREKRSQQENERWEEVVFYLTGCTMVQHLEVSVADKDSLMDALKIASSVQNQYKGTWSEPCVLSHHSYIWKLYFTMQKTNVCCAKLVDNMYLCEGFEGWHRLSL